MHRLLALTPLLWIVACATPVPSDVVAEVAQETAPSEGAEPLVDLDPWDTFAHAAPDVQQKLVAERITSTRLEAADLEACVRFLRSHDRWSVPAADEGALRVARVALSLDPSLAWARLTVFELTAFRPLRLTQFGHRPIPTILIPSNFPLEFRPDRLIPHVSYQPLRVTIPTIVPLTDPWRLQPIDWENAWPIEPAPPTPPLEKKPLPRAPGDCVLPLPR